MSMLNSLKISHKFIELIANLVVVLCIWGVFAGFDRVFTSKPVENLTLENKIQILTKNLNTAARSISEVESEISHRVELVEKLKKDAEIAEQIKTLSQKQLDAFAQTLQSVVQKESPSFWATNAASFFWTIMGVVLTYAFQYGQSLLGSRAQKPRQK